MTHPIASLIKETLEADPNPPTSRKFPGTVAFLDAKENGATDSLAVLLSHIELIRQHGMHRFKAHQRAIQS